MSIGVMLFNPFTGQPRHPSDIESDPRGVLIWDGEEPLRAAKANTPPQPVQEPVACARCKDLEEQAYDLLGQLKAANLKWSVAHPWVGLTDDEIDYQAKKDDHGAYFALGALWAGAKLKERNHGT